MWLSIWGGGGVHWVQVVGLSRLQDLPEVALVLWWRVPLLCPLSRCALGALYLKYAFIRVLRGFLARFGVVVWVCVVLRLCVACVALYA